MSTQYPGGFITKSPVAPTTAAASGIWTVDQALQYVKAGTWPSPPIFIEDLFSTYLYTGTGASQTITNNINVSGNGGLVWIKSRSNATDHKLTDTARGVTNALISDTTAAQTTDTTGLTAFGTTGFTVGADANYNTSAATYVSWTFRKQPKFFDVVTYTGNGVASRAIAHNLGSAPGMMIVKRTNAVQSWPVYHRSVPTGTGYLNTTQQFFTGAGNGVWGDAAYNNIAPTSTVFYVGSDIEVNANGGTYVAYLFAHDAGGFPANGGGSTNGITCGSYTGNGSSANGPIVTLGYEPQWLLIKDTTLSTQSWGIYDNMRGLSYTTGVELRANTTEAELTNTNRLIKLLPTGFQPSNANDALNNTGSVYIYIAIRRGPMKTPTVGTSVFSPNQVNAGPLTAVTTGFPVDLQLAAYTGVVNDKYAFDRLRGISTSTTNTDTKRLITNLTDAEGTFANDTASWNNTGFLNAGTWASLNSIFWNFRRAPGFFDEVCYTGTGVAGLAVNHNLGVAPEMMIIKRRDTAWAWAVYYGVTNQYLVLNTTAATASDTLWNSSLQTASVFTLGDPPSVNNTGSTYVAYLFATLAGVSKVGSYTGTGALQTVNCGFTTGARFVLIKCTNSTGGWYVWDSARGISSGNDPYLLLNSTATQVTATNYVDTTSVGFQVTAAAPAELNAVGGNYIFLAIA